MLPPEILLPLLLALCAALALAVVWLRWRLQQTKASAPRTTNPTTHASEQEDYRALFEQAGIGLVRLGPDGAWRRANHLAGQLLGYTDGRALLAALTNSPDTATNLFVEPAAFANFLAGLRTAPQQDIELAMRRDDGQIIWASWSGRAVQEQGTISSFECTLYDVTARRQAQHELLAAKEQADFANRSKSEFLANMSHELRTPLNAIIGFAEIIKDELFGPAGQPQYVEYAKDVYDSGQLLLSLINDILDMSKIEAGKRELAENSLDITKVINACLRLVAARAKAQRLRLVARVPQNAPDLRAEERALKQILTNLLTNAIKFTPEGGQVTMIVNLNQAGEMLIIIEDTGIGIAPEDIPVALAPFGQIESALSRKTQGTGLGLPLTKALVELHGGKLELQSQLGQGTKVILTFPRSRVVARQATSLGSLAAHS